MARNVQQKAVIKFPKEFRNLDPIQRLAAGREIVNFIRERTAKGLDKDNKEFSKVKGAKNRKGDYSKEYVDSLDFKNAGKSRSPINLELSGDMLSSIKVLNNSKSGQITIGLEAGDADNPKMEGNRKGTYGNARPVVKGRDPLGITQEDLRGILSKYQTQDIRSTRQLERNRQNLAQATTQILEGRRRVGGQDQFDDISTQIRIDAERLRRINERLQREVGENDGG